MKVILSTNSHSLSEEALCWLAGYKNWKVNKIFSLDKQKNIQSGFFTFFDEYYLVEEQGNENDIKECLQRVGSTAHGEYKKYTVMEIEDDDLFDPDVPREEEPIEDDDGLL
jgi:hypothetical protein